MASQVLLIKPKRFVDDRGWFCEPYNKNRFKDLGIADDFVQDNQSLSVRAGTLRGLHFQTPPHQQGKLVRCVMGKIFDVVVDIRKGSPTYAQWVGAELTAENGYQLYVPAGYAHGFLTLEESTEVMYKVTDFYAPKNDAGLQWNDPQINIRWPFLEGAEPLLSPKDQAQALLADFDSPFLYDGVPMSLVEV